LPSRDGAGGGQPDAYNHSLDSYPKLILP
jgi:hypothetical protein